MGNIRVRKTITLPNGIKININKDSISYTGKDIFGNKLTINPKKETKTTSAKICDGVTYVDKKSLKEKSVKIREPKLNEFYNDTLNKCIKGMLFTSMCTEGETIEDGFLPVQDFELPKFKTI